MKRTKSSNATRADLILTGDWHLREDQPICRTDDYWTEQWRKIRIIKNLQLQHRCPVIQPGDFFDHWKPSPRLLAQTFLSMPDDVWIVYGNHDLPQHSFELREKSGLFALASGTGGHVRVLEGGHWDQDVGEGVEVNGRRVLVLHTPVYAKSVPPWHTGARTAREVIDEYPDFDLIVTGDLHERFVYESKDRILVNAGSIMRMTADQIDFEPAIYLWYASDNSVREVPIPIKSGVVSREHLERQHEREARYEAFIKRLRQEGVPELSFRANLDRHFEQNDTLPAVRNFLYKMLEREDG